LFTTVSGVAVITPDPARTSQTRRVRPEPPLDPQSPWQRSTTSRFVPTAID
jgi:hypothetical protein